MFKYYFFIFLSDFLFPSVESSDPLVIVIVALKVYMHKYNYINLTSALKY